MMTQKIGDNLIPFCEHCPGSNDVAILTLSSEIRYSNRVRPICLPSSDVNDMGLPNNYDDEIVLAAGFGVHELNETWNRPAQNFDLSCFGQKCPTAKNVSDTEGVTTALLKTEMRVISNAKCRDEWKSARIFLSDWKMGNSINKDLWSSIGGKEEDFEKVIKLLPDLRFVFRR